MYRLPITPPRSASPGSSPEPVAHEDYDVDVPVDTRLKHARLRRRRIRSVLMRAGTSKGLFFRLEDLPVDRAEWRDVILAAMGSPDKNMKQLDGMGGGASTQSKVAVVSASSDPRADVDYLFIQVPIDGGELDYSGNCGNMASGVGPFAVEEGMLKVPDAGQQDVLVKIRNVNTNRIIHSSFAIEDGVPIESGKMALDGVGAPGAPIRLDFTDPAGSMTGTLLPTGQAIETVSSHGLTLQVSCVDAANPFIFVRAADLGLSGSESLDTIHKQCVEVLMDVRAQMAVRMGLARTVAAARLVGGTPKIALVGSPADYTATSGRHIKADETDIWVRPYSMGRPHPSIQMTGAVCVAAAAVVPGSVVNLLADGKGASSLVIGHGGGTMTTEGKSFVDPQGQVTVVRGSVYRTARRLMEGTVMYLGK